MTIKEYSTMLVSKISFSQNFFSLALISLSISSAMIKTVMAPKITRMKIKSYIIITSAIHKKKTFLLLNSWSSQNGWCMFFELFSFLSSFDFSIFFLNSEGQKWAHVGNICWYIQFPGQILLCISPIWASTVQSLEKFHSHPLFRSPMLNIK